MLSSGGGGLGLSCRLLGRRSPRGRLRQLGIRSTRCRLLRCLELGLRILSPGLCSCQLGLCIARLGRELVLSSGSGGPGLSCCLLGRRSGGLGLCCLLLGRGGLRLGLCGLLVGSLGIHIRVPST